MHVADLSIGDDEALLVAPSEFGLKLAAVEYLAKSVPA